MPIQSVRQRGVDHISIRRNSYQIWKAALPWLLFCRMRCRARQVWTGNPESWFEVSHCRDSIMRSMLSQNRQNALVLHLKWLKLSCVSLPFRDELMEQVLFQISSLSVYYCHFTVNSLSVAVSHMTLSV